MSRAENRKPPRPAKPAPPPAADEEAAEQRAGIINLGAGLGIMVEVFPSVWHLGFRSWADVALVTLAELGPASSQGPAAFGIWTTEPDPELILSVLVADHPSRAAAWNKAFGIACDMAIAALPEAHRAAPTH